MLKTMSGYDWLAAPSQLGLRCPPAKAYMRSRGLLCAPAKATVALSAALAEHADKGKTYTNTRELAAGIEWCAMGSSSGTTISSLAALDLNTAQLYFDNSSQ